MGPKSHCLQLCIHLCYHQIKYQEYQMNQFLFKVWLIQANLISEYLVLYPAMMMA